MLMRKTGWRTDRMWTFGTCYGWIVDVSWDITSRRIVLPCHGKALELRCHCECESKMKRLEMEMVVSASLFSRLCQLFNFVARCTPCVIHRAFIFDIGVSVVAGFKARACTKQGVHCQAIDAHSR